MIQWMLAIWSLVPLPFLNPPCTSGSSWFMYCWSLACHLLGTIKWHLRCPKKDQHFQSRLFGKVLLLTSTLEDMFSSVQSCLTLCDPMNRSTPGLPVHHQLPEFTQTHVHRVGDAIQPCHPLSPPSCPALNLSQGSFPVSWLFLSGS